MITAYKWLYREKNKRKQEFFNLLKKGHNKNQEEEVKSETNINRNL